MRRAGTILSLTAALVVVAAACQPTVDYAAEEQAIRDLDAEWVACVAAKDAAKCASFYAADGSLLPPGMDPVMGTAALEQAWAGIIEALPYLHFEPTRIVVAVGGDMAWDYGTWRVTDAPDGAVVDHGKYLVVWQKIDGEWKVVADMFNTSVPAEM
jgi:uncharacterized protein (TIGR02246 family)